LAISRRGLQRRARLDAEGRNEGRYLDCLDAIASSGRTAAEGWLDRYENVWNGDIDRIFAEASF
jgi:glutamate--cysteine ligase